MACSIRKCPAAYRPLRSVATIRWKCSWSESRACSGKALLHRRDSVKRDNVAMDLV